MSATRVMIIRGPGSGKSRLALRLSRLLDIAVYYVDEAVHDEDEMILGSAGKDIATYTVRTNKDADELLRILARKKY